MAAAITTFVDVTVNVASTPATKFQFGNLLGVFDHSVTANRQDGPFFTPLELDAGGFDSTSAPQVNAWGNAALSQDDGVDSIIIGREDAVDADMTVTLDAVEAAGEDTWYLTNTESRVQADIELAAAWHESRMKIYMPQSSDAAILVGTPANVALNLQTANYNRTGLVYHATNTDYLDGAYSSSGGGLNLDVAAGSWAYRGPLEGVAFDDITGAEAQQIEAANANFYGRNLGLSFTFPGKMASGRAFETQTTIDWVTRRIQESVLTLFVATPTKIPFTNAGIAQMAAAVQAVLDAGISAGHFAVGATVFIPDVSTFSETEKQDGVFTLTATVTFAGTIRKLVLTVNINF